MGARGIIVAAATNLNFRIEARHIDVTSNTSVHDATAFIAQVFGGIDYCDATAFVAQVFGGIDYCVNSAGVSPFPLASRSPRT